MKTLATLYFLITLNISLAQLMDHKFHLYGYYGLGSVQGTAYTNDQSSSYSIGGVRGEILLKKHVGLNYNFDYQMRKDSIRQFHSTMGIVGAPILFGIGLMKSIDGDTTTTGAGGILGGLLLLVLPDGISYHLSPTYGWDVSPYANILGLDFIKDRKNDERFFKYACSFGVKGTYIIKDLLTVTAYTETRQAAKFGWGFGGGIGIGVLLGKKEVALPPIE